MEKDSCADNTPVYRLTQKKSIGTFFTRYPPKFFVPALCVKFDKAAPYTLFFSIGNQKNIFILKY